MTGKTECEPSRKDAGPKREGLRFRMAFFLTW